MKTKYRFYPEGHTYDGGSISVSTLIGKYQEYTCADIENIRNKGFNFKLTPLSESIKKYVNYLILKSENDI